jgi:alcohol dehydrogenase class IV
VLGKHLIELMRSTGIPNGISGVGYGEGDVGALSEGAFAQQRLLTNSPREVGRDDLGRLFRAAMRYW